MKSNLLVEIKIMLPSSNFYTFKASVSPEHKELFDKGRYSTWIPLFTNDEWTHMLIGDIYSMEVLS